MHPFSHVYLIPGSSLIW